MADSKDRARIENLRAAFHLNNLSREFDNVLLAISNTFNGSTLIDIGSLLSGNDSSKLWNIQSLSQAIYAQNWIIIQLLSNISEKMGTTANTANSQISHEEEREYTSAPVSSNAVSDTIYNAEQYKKTKSEIGYFESQKIWTCKKCGTINKPSAKECENCRARR